MRPACKGASGLQSARATDSGHTSDGRSLHNVVRVCAQEPTGSCDHAFDDLRSRRCVVDYSSDLTHQHSGVVGVALREGTPETLVLAIDDLLQLALAAVPPGHEAVVQNANDKLRIGPVAFANDIDRIRLHRRVAGSAEDRLAKAFRRLRLLARDEPRTDENAVCAEHERCGQPAAIADAACRDQIDSLARSQVTADTATAETAAAGMGLAAPRSYFAIQY